MVFVKSMMCAGRLKLSNVKQDGVLQTGHCYVNYAFKCVAFT